MGSAAAVDTNTDQIIPGSNLSLPTAFYCVIVQNGNLSVSLLAGFKLYGFLHELMVSMCMYADYICQNTGSLRVLREHILHNILF